MDVDQQPARFGGVRGLLPPKIPGRRAVTDYNSSMVRYMHGAYSEFERPSASWIIQMAPPHRRRAVDNIPAKYLHTSSNKEKHAINIVRWTPEGRRLLTCSASGEFTLWNGTAFNFETLMQAHDHSIRAATFSHDGDWLVSGDMSGTIRYHNRDFNRVNDFQAHHDCIRDIAFSPNDSKFVTASDDATLKIFDFSAASEMSSITGHSWEAKTVDWHPTKGLLVSGSKDHQVKLWEPRSGKCLTTLHGHKNTIVKTSFDIHTGNLLASCARDNVARIFDLRMMRDVCLLRGHNKEITTLTWHPVHPNLISTGGHDGSIHHYLLDEPNTPPGNATNVPPYDAPDPSSAPAQTIWPAYKVDQAHAMAVWSMAWHPLGHILTSGGNDRCTRFWTRARPGENVEDLRNLFQGHVQLEEPETQTEGIKAQPVNGSSLLALPGLAESMPGLVGLTDDDDAPLQPSRHMAPPASNGAWPPPPGQFSPPPPPMFIAMAPNGQSGAPFIPGMPPIPPDPEKFMELVREGKLPPPPPGFNGIPPGMPPPPGMAPPGIGVPPPSGAPGFNGMNGMNGMNNDSLRKRTPLPSQLEGFKTEQKRGNFRKAR